MKNSKGTILYIGGFELPDKNAAAHRVLNNAKIFSKIGYDVAFVGIDKSLNYKNNIFTTEKKVNNFTSWSIPYPNSTKEWGDYLTNTNNLEKVIDTFSDLKAVICYNYQSISFIKLKKSCEKKGILVLADATEWYSTKNSNLLFKVLKGTDSFTRMRMIHKKVSGIIVISKYLETYYKKSNENVLRLPALVDLTEDKWNNKIKDNQTNIKKLVYAGSPGKDKDKLDLLIESLSKLRDDLDYQLKVVGLTEIEYLNKYNTSTEKLKKLGNRVVFLGRISHEKSLEVIKSADFSIFIRNSTRETNAGFPTKFSESISCGTPVLTTNTSDLSLYLKEGVNGFFLEIEDEKKLNKKLEYILTYDREKNNRMKKECKNSKLFDYTNYISETETFLKKIRRNEMM
ncbi:glycosyltransferase [Desemzia incerta]|uniref:glycosyltransferase n=1 Tax=Desemzia incerta TaxID=82801 RepID=UPI0016617D08|nr:glycosyltransferase [Desemzia incerta]